MRRPRKKEKKSDATSACVRAAGIAGDQKRRCAGNMLSAAAFQDTCHDKESEARFPHVPRRALPLSSASDPIEIPDSYPLREQVQAPMRNKNSTSNNATSFGRKVGKKRIEVSLTSSARGRGARGRSTGAVSEGARLVGASSHCACLSRSFVGRAVAEYRHH